MAQAMKIAIVDDEQDMRQSISQWLALSGYDTETFASAEEALKTLGPDYPGIVISDIKMPGMDGMQFLKKLMGTDSSLPVIMITGHGDVPMAVEAMRVGAFDFLEKPCEAATLLAVLERALKTRALVLENRRLKVQLERGDPAARMLFGTSPQSNELRARVRTVAPTNAEVLVSGPPGSGISKVAEVVHLMSRRGQGAFVKRPCATLTPEQFDDFCTSAEGGSLFLDEVSAMPEATQFAVLERLEQGTSARIIAGSAADLAALVAAGKFNADLFYRLDVMRVRIPSLAERREDIPVLFRHYVSQAAEQAGIEAPELSPEILAALMAQDWPGNARSLMSAAMRFVLGMPEEVTEAADLGLAEQMAQVERSLLIAALGRQNGKAAAAAEALKLPRKTFYDKLARYGIRPDDYRR